MPASNQEQQYFKVQRIYIKHAILSTPYTPHIFLEKWDPKVKVDFNVNVHRLRASVYEVILHISVSAEQKNKTVFTLKIQQAGVFTLRGFESHDISYLLGAFCPELLFPYGCECVTHILKQAGFPNFYLSPVSFNAAYRRAVLAREQKKEA